MLLIVRTPFRELVGFPTRTYEKFSRADFMASPDVPEALFDLF